MVHTWCSGGPNPGYTGAKYRSVTLGALLLTCCPALLLIIPFVTARCFPGGSGARLCPAGRCCRCRSAAAP